MKDCPDSSSGSPVLIAVSHRGAPNTAPTNAAVRVAFASIEMGYNFHWYVIIFRVV
jgi:hypothetical protein